LVIGEVGITRPELLDVPLDGGFASADHLGQPPERVLNRRRQAVEIHGLRLREAPVASGGEIVSQLHEPDASS
jgi:hypothetical protein